jgi:hypothetical protein
MPGRLVPGGRYGSLLARSALGTAQDHEWEARDCGGRPFPELSTPSPFHHNLPLRLAITVLAHSTCITHIGSFLGTISQLNNKGSCHCYAFLAPSD